MTRIKWRSIILAGGIGAFLLLGLSLIQIIVYPGMPTQLIDVFSAIGFLDSTYPSQRMENLTSSLWCLASIPALLCTGALYGIFIRKTQNHPKKNDIVLGSVISGVIAVVISGLIELTIILIVFPLRYSLGDLMDDTNLSQSLATGTYGMLVMGIFLNSIIGMIAGIFIGVGFGAIGGLLAWVYKRT